MEAIKKPTWWETATSEQRAERVAKMKAGRAAAKAKRQENPTNLYIVLEGGSTKDWTIDNHVYKICKTLEEAVEVMNARVDAYVTDYCLLEENPGREIPRVTVAKMQERIAKSSRGELVFGVNVVDTPEDDEEDGEEENWDRGMWGNLLLTLQIKSN